VEFYQQHDKSGFCRCIVVYNPINHVTEKSVYHMMPVSLDCPFCIAPSVFSNVYKENAPNEKTGKNVNKPVYFFVNGFHVHKTKKNKTKTKTQQNMCWTPL
jgi:hypothetical protein